MLTIAVCSRGRGCRLAGMGALSREPETAMRLNRNDDSHDEYAAITQSRGEFANSQ